MILLLSPIVALEPPRCTNVSEWGPVRYHDEQQEDDADTDADIHADTDAAIHADTDIKVTWEELDPCCVSSVGRPLCKTEPSTLCGNLQEVECSLKAVNECR